MIFIRVCGGYLYGSSLIIIWNTLGSMEGNGYGILGSWPQTFSSITLDYIRYYYFTVRVCRRELVSDVAGMGRRYVIH